MLLNNKTTRKLKRIDSATKSPIYSHYQESLDGLSSVQAYRIEERMRRKNFFAVDANMRARLTWDATNRRVGKRSARMNIKNDQMKQPKGRNRLKKNRTRFQNDDCLT